MIITLLRHGRPEFDPPSVGPACPPASALQAYAASQVTELPPEHLRTLSTTTAICVTSQLQRASNTAKLLGFRNPVATGLLNESELPHPDQLYVNLPWQIFLAVYRSLWYFGYRRNCPGRTENRRQAVAAAEYLHKQAIQHTSVVAVGHGIMNWMICTELRKSGWSNKNNSGSSYWSATTLQNQANSDAS